MTVQVAVEFHKRWDPIYSDARSRIQQLGPFSFFSSTMVRACSPPSPCTCAHGIEVIGFIRQRPLSD